MADSLLNVVWIALLVIGLVGLLGGLGLLFFTSRNRAEWWTDLDQHDPECVKTG